MAEFVVSFAVGKIAGQLVEEAGSLSNVRDRVEWIEVELRRMQCFLKDAEAKQDGDQRVKNWVADIRDVAYDIDDVIDTFLCKTAQQRKEGFFRLSGRYAFVLSDPVAHWKISKKINRIMEKIHEITDSRSTYGIENIGRGGGRSFATDRLQEKRRSSSHACEEDVVGNLIHLRYLGLRGTWLKKLPPSIQFLLNLQTLDLRSTLLNPIPIVIWKMQKLRHLYFNELEEMAVNPPTDASLANLQTLHGICINQTSYVENGLSKLTNLRELGLHGDLLLHEEAIGKWIFSSERLECLKLHTRDVMGDFAKNAIPKLNFSSHPHLIKLHLKGFMAKLFDAEYFPQNLTELSLKGSFLMEDPMVKLEMLQSLRVLKLKHSAYLGKEMICSCGGFPQLHFLKLSFLNTVERWRIEDGAMGRLRQLEIIECKRLKIVPRGLQPVTTIHKLKLGYMPREFEMKVQERQGENWWLLAVEMALQASATVRHPFSAPPPSLSPTPRASSSPFKPPPKPQLRPISISLPASITIPLFSLFTPPHEAKAVSIPKDQIVSSITEVEKKIDEIQEVGSGFLDTTQRILEVVANALKPGIDAAGPILKQAGEQASKIASPAISEASKTAEEAIQSSGLDTAPILNAAKTVTEAAQQTTKLIQEAKPIASSTVETISTAEPTVIVGTAGALFVAYLLFPPIWSVISFSLRGYKGELTPAQTLDLVSTKNYVMIDIRSEKDKEKTGIPRFPSGAKNRIFAIPLEELPSKLRGLVRNSKKVEAEIVAVKISYLKKISKSSNIVIMDSYSDSAKIVARVLTSLGFKDCWTVAGGFSGSRGWLQSRLGTDYYNFAFAEIVSPSRVIPAALRRFGTTGSRSGQKLLPGSSD
ncbi:hypothetical protein VitviT2T_025958 [Vitis vinifera]|uniref:Rhodanese domain-containing protein n=2 Tax=Vitis vinifera TaxID=29760 RepID=A0ABY9DNC9_VITVI|nr:hypothetical protein VitviT2T_025958 [Vitis vinifera]